MAALWSGVQLGLVLAVVALARGEVPSARPHAWYTAVLLAAAGVVVASGGTLRPAVLRETLRARRPAVAAGTVGGSVLLLLLLGLLAGASRQALPITAVVGVATAQPLLLAIWWRASRADVAAPSLRAGVVATLVVVILVVGHVALVPLRMTDAYPFAIYPMYAQVRADPHLVPQVVFVADEGMPDERVLRPPVSRSVLRDLAVDGDLDTLAGIATELAERAGASRVVVVLEELAVAAHPEPPGMTVHGREELITVAR